MGINPARDPAARSSDRDRIVGRCHQEHLKIEKAWAQICIRLPFMNKTPARFLGDPIINQQGNAVSGFQAVSGTETIQHPCWVCPPICRHLVPRLDRCALEGHGLLSETPLSRSRLVPRGKRFSGVGTWMGRKRPWWWIVRVSCRHHLRSV